MEISETPIEEARRITHYGELKEYGENLLKRRKRRGITRIELSQKTGISCKDIESVEQGVLAFTEEEKQRIARFLRRQRII